MNSPDTPAKRYIYTSKKIRTIPTHQQRDTYTPAKRYELSRHTSKEISTNRSLQCLCLWTLSQSETSGTELQVIGAQPPPPQQEEKYPPPPHIPGKRARGPPKKTHEKNNIEKQPKRTRKKRRKKKGGGGGGGGRLTCMPKTFLVSSDPFSCRVDQ